MSDLPHSPLLVPTDTQVFLNSDGDTDNENTYELQKPKPCVGCKERSNYLSSCGDLQRSVLDIILRISLDILSISAWLGMLVYASFLWRFHGFLLKDIPVSARQLVEAATPVRLRVE